MAYTFYNSVLTNVIDETPNVKRFFFSVPELDKFTFNAGQFVQLDLPIESKVTTRAYSIASAPSENNSLELVIVLKEDGLGTPYLFNKLKIGETVKLSQPAGKFTRQELPDGDLCLICTGTGIAPFRSMVYDIINKNANSYKNINLIFGARYIHDLLYRKEFKELQNSMRGFHYIPVLSRETADKWSGETGYVHSIYKKLYAEKPNALFYLCGWKVMIMEARENLLQLGYDKKQIKFELYD